MQPRSGPMPDEWSGTFIHRDLNVNGLVHQDMKILSLFSLEFEGVRLKCYVEPKLKI